MHCNFNLSRNSVDYDFHASKQALNNLEFVHFWQALLANHGSASHDPKCGQGQLRMGLRVYVCLCRVSYRTLGKGGFPPPPLKNHGLES